MSFSYTCQSRCLSGLYPLPMNITTGRSLLPKKNRLRTLRLNIWKFRMDLIRPSAGHVFLGIWCSNYIDNFAWHIGYSSRYITSNQSQESKYYTSVVCAYIKGKDYICMESSVKGRPVSGLISLVSETSYCLHLSRLEFVHWFGAGNRPTHIWYCWV